MEKSKDNWEKAEIIGKIFSGVVVPVVIGVSVWYWNAERTARDTAAQMITIAVGVLTQDPKADATESPSLRRWAIAVLRNPSNPPELSDDAAAALEIESLGIFWSKDLISMDKQKFFDGLAEDSPALKPSP